VRTCLTFADCCGIIAWALRPSPFCMPYSS
jgi:hypothetical protein